MAERRPGMRISCGEPHSGGGGEESAPRAQALPIYSVMQAATMAELRPAMGISRWYIRAELNLETHHCEPYNAHIVPLCSASFPYTYT